MIAIPADLRSSFRTLRASPSFTLVAIALIALGIGANTAIFSVVEAVVLRPLPYADPSRLCIVWKTIPQKNLDWDWTGYPAIRDWREQNRVFEDVAAFARPEAAVVTLTEGPEPQRIQAAEVEGNLFPVLGARAMLGRIFSQTESQRGENVVVLSYGFWQRHFRGSRDVLGRTLQIDHQSRTIIGVMNPSFQFPARQTAMWFLISADPRWPKFQQYRFADAFAAVARLRPGVTLTQAGVQMNAIARRLAIRYPITDAGLGVRVIPLSDQIAGPGIRRALWILFGAVLCVLLTTADDQIRQMEAPRRFETTLLTIFGALATLLAAAGIYGLLHQAVAQKRGVAAGLLVGMAVSFGATRVLSSVLYGVSPIDPITFAAVILLLIAVALAASILPARRAAGIDPAAALRHE